MSLSRVSGPLDYISRSVMAALWPGYELVMVALWPGYELVMVALWPRYELSWPCCGLVMDVLLPGRVLDMVVLIRANGRVILVHRRGCVEFI